MSDIYPIIVNGMAIQVTLCCSFALFLKMWIGFMQHGIAKGNAQTRPPEDGVLPNGERVFGVGNFGVEKD